jgi:hypothetical protein
MPITRLLPDSADDSGGDLNPFGAATSWQGLSDGSDSTGTAAQLSNVENVKHVEGTYGNLPVGVGRVNSCQVGVRAFSDIAASCNLLVFTDTLVSRINVVPMQDVVTQHLSAAFTTYTTKAQVDALGWGLRVDFVAHNGVQAFITELWMDVNWDPAISGFKGLLLALGPLVAVGLAEMPAIARELARRTRTRILPREYAAAWRELREDRARRYFVLG